MLRNDHGLQETEGEGKGKKKFITVGQTKKMTGARRATHSCSAMEEIKKRRLEETVFVVLLQNIWNNAQHYGPPDDNGNGGTVKSTHRDRRNALLAALRGNFELWNDMFETWRDEDAFPEEWSGHEEHWRVQLEAKAPRLYEHVCKIIEAKGEGAGDFDGFVQKYNPTMEELELMQEYLLAANDMRQNAEVTGVIICREYEYYVVQECVISD